MKKVINIKKIFSLFTAVVLAAICFASFAGCKKSGLYNIGVLQFGNHESLNNCYEGFLMGLKDGGIDTDSITLDYQVSNFRSEDATAQASALANKNLDIILAIATPCAVAAASASNNVIPVVYCAVSDPVSAGLTKDSYPNVAGSSDILNFDGQLDMVKAFLPECEKIGVLYMQTEANSVSQIETLKQTASEKGLVIVEKGLTNANEIPSATDYLISQGVDCFTNLTDNTVVGALDLILEKTNAANIPVFGSEIEQVTKGCLASESLDYVELGRKTGLIAAQILKGERQASDFDILKVEDSFPCYNSGVLEFFGLQLPDAYAEILDVKGDNND